MVCREGISWPKTGSIHYYAELELSNKVLAIKGFLQQLGSRAFVPVINCTMSHDILTNQSCGYLRIFTYADNGLFQVR